MDNGKGEAVYGTFVQEGDVFYAVSRDGRFVTSGQTQEEALNMMAGVLNGYYRMAKEYGFTPLRKLADAPFATAAAERWELQPA